MSKNSFVTKKQIKKHLKVTFPKLLTQRLRKGKSQI